MAIQRLCKGCGRSIIVYDTVTNRCTDCRLKRVKQKPKKHIKQIGKGGERYSTWLHAVARPYLEKRYGRKCSRCGAPPPVDEETGEDMWHHVDHIKKRKMGGAKSLVINVHNIRFLCGKCHSEVT